MTGKAPGHTIELVVLDQTGAPLAFHRKKGRLSGLDFRYLSEPSPLFPGEPVDRKGFPLDIFEDIEYGSAPDPGTPHTGAAGLPDLCRRHRARRSRVCPPGAEPPSGILLIIAAMSHETEPFDTFAENEPGNWHRTAIVMPIASARPPPVRPLRHRTSQPANSLF